MWTYNYTNELYHHGVKGMRWGHRKAVSQAYGYGAASRYIQRRDIKRLKKQKKSGAISKSQYKAEKQSISRKASIERGKRLVNAKQNYAKIAVKGVAKTAAYGAGSAAVAAFALPLAPGAAALAIGSGAAYGAMQARNAIGRSRDIHSYKKSYR